MIQRSWLDRPLILAGSIYHLERSKSAAILWDNGRPKVKSTLVKSKHPIAIIPDLAIHLDRDKNRNGAINPEQMLTAILGIDEDPSRTSPLRARLFTHLGAPDHADGFELTLSPFYPHVRAGLEGEFVVGPRHDDLAMVFTSLAAMRMVPKMKRDLARTPVLAIFDSEECGSMSSGGAHSSFCRDILLRLAAEHPKAGKTSHGTTALAKSFAISADMAHGFHPSFPDRHDGFNRPLLNHGLVLKEDASEHYASSGYTGAVLRGICESAGLSLQTFAARQDIGCGSTIGPFLAAGLNCATVDVGAPMWSMHSTAETMGVYDLYDAFKAFSCFYTSRAIASK